MKQTIILLMLFASTSIFSQLAFTESFLGTKTFYNNEVKISEHEFKNILLKNPDAEKSYKSYKALRNTAYALDGLAILSLGYYWTKEKNDTYLYSALSFALSAYIIDLSATKKLNNAISVSNNGLGLSYRF